MPWLLSTGDDDGVVKVCPLVILHGRSSQAGCSCGTLAGENLSEPIHNISTTSQIFSGWMTESKRSSQGECNGDHLVIFIVNTFPLGSTVEMAPCP